MDNFNNFFDDQRGSSSDKTPVYHTPSPKRNSNNNITLILCIVLAVVMSLVVIVNVIVLATLKSTIAAEYAASIKEDMRSQYDEAISDLLNDTNIVQDVTDAATNEALKALNANIGELADTLSASVCRLYMYKSATANPSRDKCDSIASAFLITDSVDGSSRYLATNAHCASYVAEKSESVGGGFFGGIGTKVSYYWTAYGTIICKFEGEQSYFRTSVVSYGGYTDSGYPNLKAANEQPDLAILKIEGDQPDNVKHPSIPIASDDYCKRGTAVALVGNPEGIGVTNSVTTGCISQTGITIDSWGPGKFILTDAAVNSGNSGGPMLNSRGIVVGVVESKLIDEGIDNMGFAISAKTLCEFIEWTEQENSIDIPYTSVYGNQ